MFDFIDNVKIKDSNFMFITQRRYFLKKRHFILDEDKAVEFVYLLRTIFYSEPSDEREITETVLAHSREINICDLPELTKKRLLKEESIKDQVEITNKTAEDIIENSKYNQDFLFTLNLKKLDD